MSQQDSYEPYINLALVGGEKASKWALGRATWRVLGYSGPLGESELSALRAVAAHPNSSVRTLKRISHLWMENARSRGIAIPAAIAMARLSRFADNELLYYYEELSLSRAAYLVDSALSAFCSGDVDTPTGVLHELAILHLPDWDAVDQEYLRAAPNTLRIRGEERKWQTEHTSHWLSGSRRSGLMLEIAVHPNVSEDTVRMLMEANRRTGYFDDRRLRWALLSSPGCPVDILSTACWGDSLEDAVVAMQNPRCPDDARVAGILKHR